MSNYNRVIIMGRLTHDPELKHVSADAAVAKFTIAVNRKTREGEEASFIECEAWGKTGEVISNYCPKGSLVHVEGFLKQDKWQDTKDPSVTRSKLFVSVRSVELMPKSSSNQQGSASTTPAFANDTGGDPF